MANVITDESQRKFPLRRPEGWKPKLPRWTLVLPDVKELAVTYVGIQPRSKDIVVVPGIQAIEKWIHESTHPPSITDRFEVISGRDQAGTTVWACYWVDRASAAKSTRELDLAGIHSSLEDRESIGLWKEWIVPDMTCFETNYAGDDYRPGLAQLSGTQQIQHELTGYWGAARDRMYASAYDDFDRSNTNTKKDAQISEAKTGISHFRGTNETTIAHIRSGQFWENSSAEERDAYENDLEPHLRNGLDDIYHRPEDLGDFGLRFLRNIREEDIGKTARTRLRETCASGFFRSLADLEGWAKDCPSHHKIYGGSIHHRHKFGTSGKMRTWHEICVLKPGEASWEYLNCLPDTGTLPFQQSEIVH